MKISSERLVMSPLEEADWPLFYRLHSEPAVISLCFDKPTLQEIKAKFHARLNTGNAALGKWLCLVISELNSGEKVGVTGFCLQDGVAELGYLLLPEYHGLGYGTESLLRLIAYAKSQCGITHFKAVVTQGNLGSERVLLKNGFKLDHTIAAAYKIGGKVYADHIYILNEQ